MILQVLDWIDQHNAFAMVLLTLVYVVTTIVIVRKQAKANKIAERALETSLKLERQRNRPFVVFDIESRDKCLFAVIKNIGPQPAIDVHVQIEPPIRRDSKHLPQHLSFVTTPISFMPPGRQIEDFIGVSWKYLQDVKDQSYRIDISYRGADATEYRESESASAEHYRDRLTVSSETAEDKIARAVAGMERSFNEVARCASQIAWTVSNVANRPSLREEEPAAVKAANTPKLSSEELAYLRQIAEPQNEGHIHSALLSHSGGEENEKYQAMIDRFLICGLLRKEMDCFILTHRAYQLLREKASGDRPSHINSDESSA